jgi:hypothetical protein
VGELGGQIAVGPYPGLCHLYIGKDAREGIEGIVGECPAIIGMFESVSILSSYSASGAKGSVVVGPGWTSAADGCRFIVRIDLPGSPGLGKPGRVHQI